MGIFDDKKYEELDWISQAVEPVESDLMGAIARVPDEIEVDYELYKELNSGAFDRGFRLVYCLDTIMKKFANRAITYEEKPFIRKVFTMSVEPGTLISFAEKKIIGSIKILKKSEALNEKDLISLVGVGALSRVEEMRYIRHEAATIVRLNEVLEMLGKVSQESFRTRSFRNKLAGVKNRLRTIFKEDEWRIRSPELGDKVGKWIQEYVEHGNLAAWSNFCRLKLMTHNEKAIYSIQEAE